MTLLMLLTNLLTSSNLLKDVFEDFDTETIEDPPITILMDEIDNEEPTA